jgi:hypothetical protein
MSGASVLRTLLTKDTFKDLILCLLQIFGVNDTGPLYQVQRSALEKSVWHRQEIFKIRIYPLGIYLRNGRWNAIDISIVGLFIVSYTLRFTLPLELFQMARFVLAVTVILSYFRLLRFWFVLPSIGPRIIVMQMMVSAVVCLLILRASC